MTYELEFFDEFIQNERKAHQSSAPHSTIPDFSEKKKLIEDEVERIKKSLRNFLFNTENENQIENVIQHHQQHIISLADQVLKCIDEAEASRLNQISDGETKLNLCKIIYKSLEELLTFIETYFSKYFNQDEKIPLAYAIMAEKEILEKLEALEIEAKDKKVDERLLEVALYPIKAFANHQSKNGITFRRLIYLKQLVKDLDPLLKKETSEDYTDDVFGLMFYLNFNTFYFLTFATNKISSEVKELSTLVHQVERLSFWVKLLNQNQVKPGFALKCDRPSIQEQLSQWLSEEIHFIEKQKQLTFMMPPSGPLVKSESFKVNTILSVPQLAYSIRLLKEAGIITNQNQTELIRFFSQYFSTPRNQNLSSESLRIKYYNNDRSSIRFVQGILDKLMEHSKKEKY